MSYEKLSTAEENAGSSVPETSIELTELTNETGNLIVELGNLQGVSTHDMNEIVEDPKLFKEISQHRPGLGLLYMVGASLLLSVMSLLVKVVGTQLPPFEVVFARSFIQGIIITIVMLITRVPLFGKRQHRKLLIIRGLVGFMSLSCFFYSIINLPLNEAIVLSFTNPIFTALWAMLLLKEKWERLDIVGAFLSLLGVFFIARPAFIWGSDETEDTNATQRTMAIIISIVGAVFAGAAYVTVRKLGDVVNPMVFVFYFSWVSCLLAPLASILTEAFVWPSTKNWFALLGVGVVSAIGQTLLNRGFQLEKAAKASAMNYLQIVFAFIWEVSIFHEDISWWSIGGAFLITGWAGITGYKSWRNSKKQVANH